MASQNTDSPYRLPTPVGNTGPLADCSQVLNNAGQPVDRQRMETYVGGKNAKVNSGVGPQLISGTPGAALGFLVTHVGGAGAIIFYDGTSAGGNVIGIVPPNAPLAQYYPFNMPATIGIFAQADPDSAAGTIGYQ